MPDRRDRFNRAEAANSAAEEHLRRTREFLEQSRSDLDQLQGAVAANTEHIGVSRRFIEVSDHFLKAQRQRLREIGAGLRRDGVSGDGNRPEKDAEET